jgi:hypothetical protein
MTSVGNGHLTDKQLLLYADGELATKEGAHCRAHMEACWTCRARLDDLQGTIKEIVNFRNHVLLPMAPDPSRHWDGLDPRMDELDKTIEKPPIMNRLSGLFRWGVLAPRYAVFAVLVLAALGSLVWLPSQSAISANELLARVQAAQTLELGKVPTPVLHQRLRVRRHVTGSTERSITNYDSWEDPSRGRFRETGASAQVFAELRTICNANQLDWQSPLSAAGYARWRDSLPEKQDVVAPAKVSMGGGVNAGGDPLALTTIVGRRSANNLRSQGSDVDRITKAELVVRTADWHPVEERLWVDDREYEIAELDFKVLPLSEVDALVFSDSLAPSETVKAPRPTLMEMPAKLLPPPDPDETEMAVRYRLHQLNADLGEPVEIRREARGEILVDASGASPELQAKLKEQLVSLPHTELELDKTASPACEACVVRSQEATEKVASSPLTIAPATNPNEKRLEEIFGAPRAQESFTREVLTVSGDALSHCFALRNLAVRFPREEESRLTPVVRAQLEEMVGDHIAALTEKSNRLQGLLRPLLEALSNSGTPPGIRSPDVVPEGARSDEAGGAAVPGPKTDSSPASPFLVLPWQNASVEMFVAAQKADRLVKDLLTNTNTPLAAKEAVPDLRRVLSEQQQEFKQYQGLVRLEKTADR